MHSPQPGNPFKMESFFCPDGELEFNTSKFKPSDVLQANCPFSFHKKIIMHKLCMYMYARMHIHSRVFERNSSQVQLYTITWSDMGKQTIQATCKKVYWVHLMRRYIFKHKRPEIIFVHSIIWSGWMACICQFKVSKTNFVTGTDIELITNVT